MTYQLVLLPVWVALMQGADRRSLALVNGQTGKVAFGPHNIGQRETAIMGIRTFK
jgi:hypothetical protein